MSTYSLPNAKKLFELNSRDALILNRHVFAEQHDCMSYRPVVTPISNQRLYPQKLSFLSHHFDGKLLHLILFLISLFVLERPEREFEFLPVVFTHDQVIRPAYFVEKMTFSSVRF